MDTCIIIYMRKKEQKNIFNKKSVHFEVKEDGAKNRRGLATGKVTRALSSSAAVGDLIRLSVFSEGDFLPTEPSPSLDFSVNHGVHGCSRPSSQVLCRLLHKMRPDAF